MVEQQVKLKLKDDYGKVLGLLFLKAMDRTQNNYESFELEDNRIY